MQEDYEEFTEAEVRRLKRYVTNTNKNIFALRNLPEVIKGALFSRYSRSTLGLRSLLLKDFMGNDEEASFDAIVGSFREADDEPTAQIQAIKKAQNFYDRILDGYGDDSIGELGGAHLAIENVSMIAAKSIEDCRIGGSPLEKSTRYIYFDQQVKGEYMFYREPILMTSAFRQIYISTCNMLFETYRKLIPPLTEMMQERFPKDPEISKAAYTAALRAKVLDCLRGLLPAGTLTNMGVYGNGRFFEGLIQKLQAQNLAELQEVSKGAFDELSKVIPSFVRRSEPGHRHQRGFTDFYEAMLASMKLVTEQNVGEIPIEGNSSVQLVDYDGESVHKVAAALLYPHCQCSLEELVKHCKALDEEEIAKILDASCHSRENRRHKPPRGLEFATYTFDIVADYGVYRDLQRHRILTQERQLLTCNYGYCVPDEIRDTALEPTYHEAMAQAKEVYDTIAKELPEEAQYVVPMAYNIRWLFHVNLRGLQWLSELRSSPQGHPNYRFVAQEMAKQVAEVHPQFERYFKFVDYDGYEMGRIGQEQRTAEKKQKA